MKMKHILQAEGAAVLALSIYLYAQTGGSWWFFAALILVPDVAMIGYLFGLKLGAICYNIAHNYALPTLLAAISIFTNDHLMTHIAIIWFAHIGMDRAVGYGLKYETGFKDNHLDKV